MWIKAYIKAGATLRLVSLQHLLKSRRQNDKFNSVQDIDTW